MSFYRYVRGQSDVIPDGYSEAGMRLYRHLAWLGVTQMLEAHFPELRTTLGEDNWQTLIQEFLRSSHWDSHFYGDLKDEFMAFLANTARQTA
jgi:hypothetical protein